MGFDETVAESDEHNLMLASSTRGVRPTVPMIPRIEVYERMLRGTNDNGMNITKEKSFHVVVEMVGMRALRESAKRTTRATLRLETRKW
jgi:hypothetical protein